MAWSTAGKNARAEASAALVTHFSLHDGDPGENGANELSGDGYERGVPTYGAASEGVADITDPVEFSTASEQSITHLGMWASTTFLGGFARTSGDAAANAAGEYTVATAPITSS